MLLSCPLFPVKLDDFIFTPQTLEEGFRFSNPVACHVGHGVALLRIALIDALNAAIRFAQVRGESQPPGS